MLRDKAVAVTVLRKSKAGEDEMGEPVVEWVPETVEGVLWIQHGCGRLDDGSRPEGTEDTVKLHFPKTYTAGLAGCRVELLGREYEVVGDPVGYMPDLTPGSFNRPVTARKVEG